MRSRNLNGPRVSQSLGTGDGCRVETQLVVSRSWNPLSTLLLSFAHFAKWSWALVAISCALVDHVVVLSSCWRAISLEWKRRRYREQNCDRRLAVSIRSKRFADKFLENRAANPGGDLGDEDEEEYCDQQGHGGGRWQNTPARLRDVYDDRPPATSHSMSCPPSFV